MSSHSVDTVARVHRLLAATFALVGLLFLLAPNGTVRAINAVGGVFRIFPPAPESALRFWLSLGFAYMVVVTVLAWRISTDPRAQRSLMPILAAGKLASSLTCLYFFAFDLPALLYLLNFLVDGSIALLVLGCYLWMGLLERGPEPTGREAQWLRLFTETIAPEGGAFAPGARSLKLDEAVWRYFADLHPLGTVGLTAILYGIEFSPLVFGPRRRRFSALSAREREAHLAGWESSRFPPRRQLLNALKLVVMLHFYDSPQVCAQIGYDGEYLREKLLAGPNADFHRARGG